MEGVIRAQLSDDVRRRGPLRLMECDDVAQTVHIQMLTMLGNGYGAYFEKTQFLLDQVQRLRAAGSEPARIDFVTDVIALGQEVLGVILKVAAAAIDLRRAQRTGARPKPLATALAESDAQAINAYLDRLLGKHYEGICTRIHDLRREFRNLPQTAAMPDRLEFAERSLELLDDVMGVMLRKAIDRAIGTDRSKRKKRRQRGQPCEVCVPRLESEERVPWWVREMVDLTLDVDHYLKGIDVVEWRVLVGVLEGESDRLIAQALSRSARQVRTIRSRLIRDLKALYRLDREQE